MVCSVAQVGDVRYLGCPAVDLASAVGGLGDLDNLWALDLRNHFTVEFDLLARSKPERDLVAVHRPAPELGDPGRREPKLGERIDHRRDRRVGQRLGERVPTGSGERERATAALGGRRG